MMGEVVVFFSFFVCIIHELLGTPNNNSNNLVSINYRPLLYGISSLHEVPLSSNILQRTTLNPILAECSLDTVHERNTNIFWKHPIFKYSLETPICSTQPTFLKPLKSHRPITNRLFAKNKIVVPNEQGNSEPHFVNFQYHRRSPILITLLECSCYIIKVHNYYGHSSKGIEPTIPALHSGKATLNISESNTDPAKETVIEGTSENRLDEITPQAVDEQASVPSQAKITEEGTFPRTYSNDMVILNNLHPDIQTSLPFVEGRKLFALGVSATEICVDGQRIYFFRGAAGDSSFFVYQYKNSSFYVIAHLVFSST